MKTPLLTPEQIRIAGIAALLEKLGPDGMIRFLQQLETGTGDYSTERQTWIDQLNMDTLIADIRKRQGQSQ